MVKFMGTVQNNTALRCTNRRCHFKTLSLLKKRAQQKQQDLSNLKTEVHIQLLLERGGP